TVAHVLQPVVHVQQDAFLGDVPADVVEAGVAVQRVDEAVEPFEELAGPELGETTGAFLPLGQQHVAVEVRGGGHGGETYAAVRLSTSRQRSSSRRPMHEAITAS